MADSIEQGTATGQASPDERSEHAAKQQAFLARKAAQVIRRLEARDEAVAPDAAKGAAISLEELITGRHVDLVSVWFPH